MPALSGTILSIKGRLRSPGVSCLVMGTSICAQLTFEPPILLAGHTRSLMLRELMNRGLDLRVPSDSLGYAGYAVCRP